MQHVGAGKDGSRGKNNGLVSIVSLTSQAASPSVLSAFPFLSQYGRAAMLQELSHLEGKNAPGGISKILSPLPF